MTFFYDMNKKLAELDKAKEQLNEGAKPAVAEGSTGDYSARKARDGKDIGRPGKAFAKIAKSAAGRGGAKVAGKVLADLRKAHPKEDVAEGSLEEYGDTAKGQKMLGKVRNRALKNMMKEPVSDMPSQAVYNKNAQSLDRADARAKWNPGVREPMYKYYNQKSNKGMAQDDMEEGKGDGNLANNYPPYGEVTRGDVIAGRLGKDQMGGKAKKTNEASKVKPFSHDDYDEFGVRHSSSFNQPPRAKKSKVDGRDMTPDLTRAVEKASGDKETLRRDAKGVLQVVKKKTEKKVDEIRLADLPKRTVQGKHYGGDLQKDHPEHDDEMDDSPKKTGRKTVGAGKGKKIGAKVKGTSKLHKKPAIREDDVEIQDRGEYDMEGSAVKDDIHSIIRDVKALHNVLADDENLPEWVQSKMAKAEGMISSVRDYMLTRHEREGEQGTEMELDEKAVSVARRRAAGIAHAAQKGEIPKSKLRGASKEMAKMDKKELHKFAATKERGLPAKKEEVEETTVSGSVATAPAPKAESAEAPKKSKGGMQFGKGIYDSMNRDLEAMIAESMSINISSSTEGGNSVTVTATDEDAARLKEMLKNAGIGDESHSEHACPSCGQEPCACAEVVDENQPEWPTNTETSQDALQYSGGLNKPKTDVAGAGQTTVPATAVRVQEGEEEELDESKCMECGMYEDKCECDKPMDESLERIMELAGVQEAAKPDFLDIDKDGNKDEPMKKAAQDKEKQDDKKVEESILDLRRLWQEYKG
jgi:hypothetical protein